MSAQWYCKIGKGQHGPLTSDLLRHMAKSGQLTPDDLVRQGDEGPWRPAAQVKGLFPKGAQAAAQPPAPRATGDTLRARGDATLRTESAPAVPPRSVSIPGPLPGMSIPGPNPGMPPPGPATIPMGTPAPIPSGIPVGTPAPLGAAPPGIPSGIPMGAAVPQGVPAGLPVGMAVNPAAAPGAIFVPATGAATGGDSRSEAKGRKKKNNYTLLIGLVATIVAVAAVGLFLILGGGKPDSAEVAEVEATTTVEGEPSEPTELVEPPASAAPLTPVIERPAEPPKAADRRLQALDSISKWRDADKWFGVTGPLNVRITFEAVWLGDDPSASDIAAPPATTIAPVDGTPAPAVTGGTTGKYLFARINILNTGNEKDLKYTSWNTAADPAVAAILADQAGQLCSLVSYEEANSTVRQRTATIKPAQSITELLVFRAPSGALEELRVGLPYAAFGTNGSQYFGVKVTSEMLGHRRVEKTAAGAVATAPPASPETDAIMGVRPVNPHMIEVPKPGMDGQPQPVDPGQAAFKTFLEGLNGPKNPPMANPNPAGGMPANPQPQPN